ncbi:MAG: hypothetical protein MJK13_08715, partial [Pseudomonadales bacterium]|nr:hypothetical protein [Pseudomonadales bacterium]
MHEVKQGTTAMRIKVAKVFTETQVLDNACVTFSQQIEDIVADSNSGQSTTKDAGCSDSPILDYSDYWLIPGLIDTHAHGAMGCDVMDASHHSLNTMSEYFASIGVTGFLPTTMTADKADICAALQQIHLSKAQG